MKNCSQILSSLLILFLFFGLNQHVQAQEVNGSSKEETFTLLKEAFEAQVSLTEKERTLDEIKNTLSEYFSESIVEKYIEANVHEFDGKYIVYGTDFPQQTIPFFDYDENTKVIGDDHKIIVYQFYEETTEGPVSYDDHYQVVTLKKYDGRWLVESIEESSEEPKEVTSKERSNEEKNERVETKDNKDTSAVRPLQSSLNMFALNEKQEVKLIFTVFTPFYYTTQQLLGSYLKEKQNSNSTILTFINY